MVDVLQQAFEAQAKTLRDWRHCVTAEDVAAAHARWKAGELPRYADVVTRYSVGEWQARPEVFGTPEA